MRTTTISVIVPGAVSDATRLLLTGELRDRGEPRPETDPDEVLLVLCPELGEVVTFRSERTLSMTLAVAYAWFGERGIVAPFAYINEIA